MHLFNRSLVTLASSFFFAATGNCTVIDFTATQLAGSQWRYDYVVKNDTLSIDIYNFYIEFDRNRYSNLDVAARPANWDVFLGQPDPSIPIDGAYSAVATRGEIGIGRIRPGGSQAGFAVIFDYLGPTLPAEQPFAVIVFNERDGSRLVDSGFTTAATAVSEPATLTLALAGMGLFPLLRRKSARLQAAPGC